MSGQRGGSSIADRVKRAGCWANALFIAAGFFAFGMLVSLFNADFITAGQSLLVVAIAGAVGVWVARRRVG